MFFLKDQYLFDSVGSLVITSGSLSILAGKAYEFYIEAHHQASYYGQSVIIWIENIPEVPIVSI